MIGTSVIVTVIVGAAMMSMLTSTHYFYQFINITTLSFSALLNSIDLHEKCHGVSSMDQQTRLKTTLKYLRMKGCQETDVHSYSDVVFKSPVRESGLHTQQVILVH